MKDWFAVGFKQSIWLYVLFWFVMFTNIFSRSLKVETVHCCLFTVVLCTNIFYLNSLSTRHFLLFQHLILLLVLWIFVAASILFLCRYCKFCLNFDFQKIQISFYASLCRHRKTLQHLFLKWNRILTKKAKFERILKVHLWWAEYNSVFWQIRAPPGVSCKNVAEPTKSRRRQIV